MSQKDDFLSDPRNKLGNVDWEDGLDDFTSALNSGTTVRPNGVDSVAESSGEVQLTEDDLLRLRALFANYR